MSGRYRCSTKTVPLLQTEDGRMNKNQIGTHWKLGTSFLQCVFEYFGDFSATNCIPNEEYMKCEPIKGICGFYGCKRLFPSTPNLAFFFYPNYNLFYSTPISKAISANKLFWSTLWRSRKANIETKKKIRINNSSISRQSFQIIDKSFNYLQFALIRSTKNPRNWLSRDKKNVIKA